MDKSAESLKGGVSAVMPACMRRVGKVYLSIVEPVLYAIFLSLNDNMFSLSLCNTDA
jgi:hypothetical protein